MSRQRKTKLKRSDECDALLLHGTGIEVVNYVKELCGSLGLGAQTVLDLPSRKKRQEDRVNYYIMHCRIPIIIVTFDDNTPGSRRARPNVYDEIARCRAYKRQDALILRESDTGGPVELPSNVYGEAVIIEFDRSKLHALAPRVIKEVMSRNLLVGKLDASPAEKAMISGKTVNNFMDQMDHLWDNEFDKAWDRIHSLDYQAERNFAIELDKFFQWFHKVFEALVRGRKQGEDLRGVCDDAIAASTLAAARAWEYVAEAKLRKALDHAHSLDGERQKDSHRRLLDEGDRDLTAGKSLDASETGSRIERFRRAVVLFDQYLTKHNK